MFPIHQLRVFVVSFNECEIRSTLILARLHSD